MAAWLVCVEDEEVVGVLLVDSDESEVGTAGMEDDDVVTVVDNDDCTALAGSLTEDGSVDLFNAIEDCEDVVFFAAGAEFCALHSAWKNWYASKGNRVVSFNHHS